MSMAKFVPQVCIDVLVQRLGDAAAAGMYKVLFGTLNGNPSTVSLYGLPVCLNLSYSPYIPFQFLRILKIKIEKIYRLSQLVLNTRTCFSFLLFFIWARLTCIFPFCRFVCSG